MRRGRGKRVQRYTKYDMNTVSTAKSNNEGGRRVQGTSSLREVHNGVRAAQTERFLDSLAANPNEVGGTGQTLGSARPPGPDSRNEKLKMPAKDDGGRRQFNGSCNGHRQVSNWKPRHGTAALKAAGFMSPSSSSPEDQDSWDGAGKEGAGSGRHAPPSSSCHDKASIFCYPFPADPHSKQKSTQGNDLKRDIGKYILYNAIDVGLNPPGEAEELWKGIKTEPCEEEEHLADPNATLSVCKPEIENVEFEIGESEKQPDGGDGGGQEDVGKVEVDEGRGSCGCKVFGWFALVDHLIQDHQFEFIDSGDDVNGGEWKVFIPVEAIERKLSQYRVIRYLGRYFLFCMLFNGDSNSIWVYRLSNKKNVNQEESYFRYYLHFVDTTETYTITFKKNCVPWSKKHSQVLQEKLCLQMADLTTSLFVNDQCGNVIIYGKLFPENPVNTMPEVRTSSMESLVVLEGLSDDCYDVTGLIDDMT